MVEKRTEVWKRMLQTACWESLRQGSPGVCVWGGVHEGLRPAHQQNPGPSKGFDYNPKPPGAVCSGHQLPRLCIEAPEARTEANSAKAPPPSPDYRLPASYSALQEPGASAAYISWKTHLVIRRLMIVFSRQHVGP